MAVTAAAVTRTRRVVATRRRGLGRRGAQNRPAPALALAATPALALVTAPASALSAPALALVKHPALARAGTPALALVTALAPDPTTAATDQAAPDFRGWLQLRRHCRLHPALVLGVVRQVEGWAGGQGGGGRGRGGWGAVGRERETSGAEAAAAGACPGAAGGGWWTRREGAEQLPEAARKLPPARLGPRHSLTRLPSREAGEAVMRKAQKENAVMWTAHEEIAVMRKGHEKEAVVQHAQGGKGVM